MPEEAAELAEVASRLIEGHPENRRAFAELAEILRAGAAGPRVVATVARFLSERGDVGATMTLPSDERQLWEDAGACFDRRSMGQDSINAAAAFSDLVMRSIEGDSAVATFLRVDRSRVSQRVRDRSLYAFNRADTRYFPRWQFTDSGTLPGLREVGTVLDERLHPLVVDHWFNTPSVDLEIGDVPVSPVIWLETGGTPQVVAELATDL